MALLTEPQKQLAEAYNSTFGGTQGRLAIDDLITTARLINDPAVRVGFQDAILHILSRMSLPRRMQLMEQRETNKGRVKIENLEGA